MVREVKAKTVLNRHKKRDDWFLDDYSLNPYQLCEINCIYCYIRGSRYGGNSEDGLSAKINAPSILEMELRRRFRKKEYGFIALSSATEPWMGIEKRYGLTRRCLEMIAKYRFPVHCLTKSTLILRDLDLLNEIDKNAIIPNDLKKINRGTLITFSLSTLDRRIARIFEPSAPKPEERLETLQKVKEAGFYAGIAYIPVLPFISDSDENLEEMVKTAREFDVDYIFAGALTLYGAGKEIYYRVLERNFPELVPEYRKLFRIFNQPPTKYQKELERRVREFCEKYGVKYRIL